MATHSCILAWKIPWTEEPGGLQSMELQSHNRAHTHEPYRSADVESPNQKSPDARTRETATSVH